MFENVVSFFKGLGKNKNEASSKDAAKERLHLVLMQDRANISADFLALMKQEIIEVIKKYIDIDETAMDVRLTNKENTDGTNGAPALYANIPIMNIKDEVRKTAQVEQSPSKEADKKEVKKTKQNNETKSKQEKSQKEEKAEVAKEQGETKKEQEETKEKVKNDNV